MNRLCAALAISSITEGRSICRRLVDPPAWAKQTCPAQKSPKVKRRSRDISPAAWENGSIGWKLPWREPSFLGRYNILGKNARIGGPALAIQFACPKGLGFGFFSPCRIPPVLAMPGTGSRKAGRRFHGDFIFPLGPAPLEGP